MEACDVEPRFKTLEQEQQRHKDALYGDNRALGLLSRTQSLENAMKDLKENRHWLITIVVGLVINAVLILLSSLMP